MTLFNSEQTSQQANSLSPVAPQPSQKQKRRLSFSDTIGIASLVVAIVAIPIGLAHPEIRCGLRLQSESCPGSISSKAEDLYKEGSALIKLNRYSDALDSFDQSIELDPKQAKVWNKRGITLERLGRNQQALASYDKALLIDSTDELARQNREALLNKISTKSSREATRN
jgi:tetratricopeptide (TPR) repeat protein